MVEFRRGVGARGRGTVPSPSALSSLTVGLFALGGAAAVPLTCDVDVVALVLAALAASVALAVPLVLAALVSGTDAAAPIACVGVQVAAARIACVATKAGALGVAAVCESCMAPAVGCAGLSSCAGAGVVGGGAAGPSG